MKLGHSKKGFAINDVPSIAILLVVIAIVLGIGATILTQTRANQCTGTFQGVTYTLVDGECVHYIDAENTTAGGTAQWNASTQGLTGLNTLASWQPTFAVIIAASVVIGIIAAYLMFGRK